MTESELIHALEEAFLHAPDDADGWMTSREIAKAMGRSARWVGDKLRDLRDEGRLLTTKQRRAAIDGTLTPVSVYKITSS